ncbi:Foldase protein PrsA 2 precursor [Polystyrenella longa]|uniref:peptidylprolyl isomerase n=1 Tax=Polystyrenella longa TaxID=2528007 RepID=A0A518CRT1_9PLAN|nr:SurA N-terminal domain-containing protein [Polystyrenella longa]QDU81920.1 Foldase protein PrsA 2 precursor [Polystyrenella longa]
MSEGTHLTSTSNKSSKKKWAIVFGTLMAVTVAAVSSQFLKSKDTQAATERKATTTASNTNTANNSAKMARVGNNFITKDELKQECLERYGKEVLETLINRKVIETACEQQGVKVEDSEVNQEIVEIAKRFQLEPDSWLQMLQAERGLTALQYKRDVIWPMIALRKLAGGDVQLTEQDIQKSFVRDYGPRVKARLIMVNQSREAQQIWKKVKENPSDFGRYAREHSVEPNSRALDGQIPPISKYSGSEEMWNAAFKLKEGEVSGIIQLSDYNQNQYCILLCEGYTQPRTTNLEDVRQDLIDHLTEEKTQKLVADVFERIKRDIAVDNYVTGVRTGGITPASGTAPEKVGSVRQAAGR